MLWQARNKEAIPILVHSQLRNICKKERIKLFLTSLSRYFVMLVFVSFLAMPAISTKPQDAEVTEMGEVTFNCNSPSEPATAVMYEWFYANTSGRLF